MRGPQDNSRQIELLSPNEIFSSTICRIWLVWSEQYSQHYLGRGVGEGAQFELPEPGALISLLQTAVRVEAAALAQAEKMLQRGGRRGPARM